MNRLHDRDDTQSARTLTLPDEAATAALGAALARALPREERLVVYLRGTLGAGKTTLVRSVLRALHYAGAVRSPTYTLVELHVVSGLNLYHFDFYRFTSPEEFLEAGLDEYFDEAAICLLEWPDRAAPFVPPADVEICLEIQENIRTAALRAASLTGTRCLANLHLPPAP
ncbi:MAG: tRNA (adenosine(37)-N6)-threonylcarbamoyltransferase complex ATPase subunit type 1 TsaE [Ottowia sp.]|nr:tRNA (adenosine(37)-N6)-threonylcarbamoyltransferase complex ATPase subunit type 1 TsaE [Ottowia sp.]